MTKTELNKKISEYQSLKNVLRNIRFIFGAAIVGMAVIAEFQLTDKPGVILSCIVITIVGAMIIDRLMRVKIKKSTIACSYCQKPLKRKYFSQAIKSGKCQSCGKSFVR